METSPSLFKRIVEGIKNALVSVFVGSIFSTIIVYLIGLNEVIEESNEDGVFAFIFLSMFFFFFVVPAIVPYFVAGIVVEGFNLSRFSAVFISVLAILGHYYIATRFGFNDWDLQDLGLLSLTYIPIFLVFLFVSLYGRKNTL